MDYLSEINTLLLLQFIDMVDILVVILCHTMLGALFLYGFYCIYLDLY